MDKKKIAKTTIILLAGILIGGGIGSAIGFHFGMKSGNMLSSALDYELLREPLQMVLSQGNCQAVKEALEKHISLVSKYKDIPESTLFGSIGYADLTLSHARLARLEQKSGNVERAREHIKLAEEACNQSHWKDCSEENILSVSMRFEEKSPIPCLKNDEE